MSLLASYLSASVVFHTSSDAGFPSSEQAKMCFSSGGSELVWPWKEGIAGGRLWLE